MNKSIAPIINFNGVFLVNSLEVGSLLVYSKRVFAVKTLFHQTLNYPILAQGRAAAEIYAYCFEAYQIGLQKLEAYASCRLTQDLQSGSQIAVVANITWYIPSTLREKCAGQVEIVMSGDILGDNLYPAFHGGTFATFLQP